MIKQRVIDYRNISIFRFLSVLLILIGIILLSVFLIFRFMSIYSYESGIILAFSIIFIGVGCILYFFHLQFNKLGRIAEEIESGRDQRVE